MPNPKMTKTVKKKPGKVRTFINSIIFNKETPKQGRKRKAKEKQDLAQTKKQQEEYDKMEFKRGGKLKKKNAGGFLSKAAGLAGPAGMLMQGIGAMRKKRGGKLWSNRDNQFD